MRNGRLTEGTLGSVFESLIDRCGGPVWKSRSDSSRLASAIRGVGEAIPEGRAHAELVPQVARPIGGRVKRCLDLFVSLLLLPVAAVLTLPIVLLIILGGGNPIFRHLRAGWNGRLFCCYKFRTMIADADEALEKLLFRDRDAREEWFERYKLERDPRVTRLGWFLRSTNLDEVPQIWNVLRGDMSWVGPRPVISDELSKYGRHLPYYLACRPGVTGLWQVCRRSNTSYGERVALDAEYARNWSVASDLRILLVTIPKIVAANVHLRAKTRRSERVLP